MENGGVLLEAEKEFQKRYRLSSWWIGHRDALKKILLVLFACADAAIVAFVGWTFVDAYLVSYADEQRATLELAAYGQSDLRAYSSATAAKDLSPGSAAALSSTEGKYDLYSVLTNPNDDWWAEFEYAFSSSAGETSFARGFVLPGEEKPIVSYAFASATMPKSIKVVLSDVVWHRVDHHETGDYDRWIADRVNFVVENAVFERVDVDGKTVGRASFKVTNDSAYAYYEPSFTVTLLHGSSVVGVIGTSLSDIGAGETRDVVVNWTGPIPSNVGKVAVKVSVNPFDASAYKPLEGETAGDARSTVPTRGSR